ncbi:hypothetical protein M8818_000083 [Zalaria obscura]|uniref:Uncharacterized protein n=1 Tax=Zalaria obscura TaxID=2024903 RepID=A0ACC3SP23_9PEZI
MLSVYKVSPGYHTSTKRASPVLFFQSGFTAQGRHLKRRVFAKENPHSPASLMAPAACWSAYREGAIHQNRSWDSSKIINLPRA